MTGELNKEARYLRKLKIRLGASFVIITCGMVAICFYFYLQSLHLTSSTVNGFFIGTGGGLMGAGIVTAVKSWMLLKDDAKRKEKEMEEYDERNLFLRERAMTYSGYGIVSILYIGTIVMALVNETISMTLLAILGIYLLLVCIINTVLKKRG